MIYSRVTLNEIFINWLRMTLPVTGCSTYSLGISGWMTTITIIIIIIIIITHRELCNKCKFDHRNKWYMENIDSVLEDETHKIPLEFWDKNGTTRPSDSQKKKKKRKKKRKKKKNVGKIDFTVPADHRVKLKKNPLQKKTKNKNKNKKNEKRDTYWDVARELKRLWNMKVTVKPIVFSARGIVTEGLVQGLKNLEIRGQEETIQTATLLRSVRILIIVLEAWGDLLSLRLQWKTIS